MLNFLLFFGAVCGVSFGASIQESRIVGGDLINIESYPHQAAIFYGDDHHCGGSILNEKFILTAGHCMHQMSSNERKQLKVYVGLNKSSDAFSRESISISEIILHPNISTRKQLSNDIALLKVYPPIKFNASVQPITLARREPTEGQYVTATGYGKISEEGPESNALLAVTVPIVSKDYCFEVYSSFNISILQEQMICAGYQKGERDVCRGDSGGPVIFNGKQVGIVSFGYSCAAPGIPSVFTNVFHYIKWINDSMKL